MPDTQPIRILLIEDNPGDARLIREALSAAGGPSVEVEVAGRLLAGLARIEQDAYDAVLLDLSLPDSRGLDSFESVHRLAPALPVVVLTGLDDEELALTAVARGAQDYLVKGAVRPAALLRILRFAVERGKAMHQALGAAGGEPAGKLIGVMGAKGGCGATTVSLNLAAALARQGKPVVAVELSPYRAGLTLQLRLSPRRDLAELLALEPGRLSAAELRKALVASDFGVQILFAPQEPRDWANLTPDGVTAVLNAAAAAFGYVVVDLPATPGPAHRACVRMCDPFLLVTDREPAGMAAGRSLVPLLEAWEPAKNALAAVLVTRNPMGGFVSAAQVSTELGIPVVAVIPPAAEALETAYRQGAPLLVAEPDSLPADSLRLLAQRIASNTLAGIRE